jgi:DNA-binding winged helix-turn-helix (wHTH) protein/Tol biopolymer transport system component
VTLSNGSPGDRPSDRAAGEGLTLVFGPYALDTRAKRLLSGGTPVPLTTKAFETLEVLIRAAGQTVSKEDLLKQVWPGTFVQEDTLAQNISTIRRALGETADSPHYVVTVPREGYRFVAPVEVVNGNHVVPDLVAGETVSQPRPQSRHAWAIRPRLLSFTIGVGSGIVLAALVASWVRRPEPNRSRPATTFEVFEPEGARFSSSGGAIALSPDGRQLAFLAEDANRQDRLYLRSSDSRVSRPLPGTEDASQPFWSFDSRSIAFFSRGALRRIDVSDGEVRTISQLPSNANALAGSWSSRNVILFTLIGGGLYQVRASGGDASRVRPPGLGECEECLWPFFLPDGQHFLFTVLMRANRGIYVGTLDGTAPRRLLDSASSAVYSDGYLVYASGGALVARRFDPERGEVGADITPVADRVWFNPVTTRAAFSASNAGVLAYREPVVTRLQWISRSGNAISTGPEGLFHAFAVSLDGRVLVSQLDPLRGTYDLWLHDPDWKSATRVTFDPGSDLTPLWSEDGTRAVFARDSGANGWQLYEINVANLGVERPLLEHASLHELTPIAWMKEVLYYSTSQSGHGGAVWMVRTAEDSRTPPTIAADSSYGELSGRISPNGTSVAYTLNVSDSRVPHSTLFVRPWPGGQGQSQITADGSAPRWRADGHELFYMAPDGRLMAVAVQDGLAIGSPETLCSTNAMAETGLVGNTYDVSPDGQRFLVKVPARRPSIVMMTGWPSQADR